MNIAESNAAEDKFWREGDRADEWAAAINDPFHGGPDAAVLGDDEEPEADTVYEDPEGGYRVFIDGAWAYYESHHEAEKDTL